MMKIVASSLSLSLLVVACSGTSTGTGTDGGAARAPTIAKLTPNTAAGKTLYTDKCSICHGNDGKSGSAARNVAEIAANSQTRSIEQVISGSSEMPSFANMTDQQIADVLGYLKSLK